jgi:hypothetical protein
MPLEVAEITMRVLKPTRVTKHTGTGWNLEGSEIAFGRCGIVGDWWKELVVEFDFGEEDGDGDGRAHGLGGRFTG